MTYDAKTKTLGYTGDTRVFYQAQKAATGETLYVSVAVKLKH